MNRRSFWVWALPAPRSDDGRERQGAHATCRPCAGSGSRRAACALLRPSMRCRTRRPAPPGWRCSAGAPGHPSPPLQRCPPAWRVLKSHPPQRAGHRPLHPRLLVAQQAHERWDAATADDCVLHVLAAAGQAAQCLCRRLLRGGPEVLSSMFWSWSCSGPPAAPPVCGAQGGAGRRERVRNGAGAQARTASARRLLTPGDRRCVCRGYLPGTY